MRKIEKNKLTIVALSVNEDILESKLMKTYHYVYDELKSKISFQLVVYTQGFDYSFEVPRGVTVVRDDSQLGKSISTVRDYFTFKTQSEYPADYLLFIDDDFKFREDSGLDIFYNIAYMDSFEDVGLVNFKMTNKSCDDYKTYQEINPSFVYMRGGILVRDSAYHGWDLSDEGFPSCKYYEESILASKIYYYGYKVYASSTHTVHRTASSGLGKSIEREYEGREEQLVQGGRQQLCEIGWFTPSMKNGKPNYRVPCKITKELVDSYEFYKCNKGLTKAF